MNFYTVAARMRKFVKINLEKYPEDQQQNAKQMLWDMAMNEHEETMKLGVQLMEDFKERFGSGRTAGPRWSLITIRPPHNTSWLRFRDDVHAFVTRWAPRWSSWEYAFEQKGESPETLGHGFHVHLLISTTTPNYYKSHIIKSLQRYFSYVAANCIQVDSVRNLDRAKAYIRGEKEASKLVAVHHDILWRNKENLQQIYEGANGQVQAVCLTDEC